MNDHRFYSQQRIKSLSDCMDKYGFDRCFVSPLDYSFVLRMSLDFWYFTAQVSYSLNEGTLLIWIDDDKSDVFSGNMPLDIQDHDDLRLFVDSKVKGIF